jgi:hypothetical protein
MNTTQNRLLQTITDSIPERISSSSPAGFAFDKASSTSMPAESSSNWLFIFLFVIGLAFLGVNLVAYLAEGTQIFADITVPLTAWFARVFGTAALETTSQTVKASSAGAKDAIDIAADTTLAGVGAIQQTTGLTPGNKPPLQNANLRQYADTNQMTGINAGKRVGQHVSTLDEEIGTMDSLTKALQNSAQSMATDAAAYYADDTTSSVQARAKAGWCLIGEEKATRNCIEVGQNDQCMSGDIFPTHEVCVNPRLRP